MILYVSASEALMENAVSLFALHILRLELLHPHADASLEFTLVHKIIHLYSVSVGHLHSWNDYARVPSIA